MAPQRVEIFGIWFYAILIWLFAYYVASDLYERGIDKLTIRQVYMPALYIFPNIFLTIGLITGRFRLFLPMIGAQLLMMVILWIQAAYEICVVFLPNAYWRVAKMDDELLYKPPLLHPLLVAFGTFVLSLYNLFIAANLYGIMDDQADGKVSPMPEKIDIIRDC